MKRYEKEAKSLAKLAVKTLNIPKNFKKGPFEELSLMKIRTLLIQELIELDNEVIIKGRKATKSFHNMYVDKAIAELGDVVACCIGFHIKLKQLKKKKKERIIIDEEFKKS